MFGYYHNNYNHNYNHDGESRDILHLYSDRTDKNICHYFCNGRVHIFYRFL